MGRTLLFKTAKNIRSLIVYSFVLLFITPQVKAQTITTNTQSTHNGFFYSFWNDGSRGSASMTLGPAGNYSTTWSNIGNFTAGKGWAVGKPDRVVCFSGNFDGGSNGFLALYGWTKNALIEYYVCENYGQWTPPGNTSGIVNKGTYTCDGGTYTIYTATRTNQPSIIGTATFQQFWSVRTQKRSSGTITFATHVAAWKAAGMNLGTTWDYQIMESEGYGSSGSSNITVSECVTCATPAPTTIASFDYELGATATQLTATGTAIKWYTVSSGGTALSSAPTPSTTTTGTTKYYVGQTLNGCEGPRVEVTIRVSQKYKIFKVPSPITIDGAIDASWTNASVLPAAAAKLLSGTLTNSADLSGNFKALWDDTYLYVLADVNDDTKINESANVYDDDAVEVYVDINNDKATTYGTNDVQYSFGWNDGTTVGVLPTGRSTTNVTYAAIAKTGGYIIEARIPWTTLQGSPAIGQLVGMDFMINDDDNNGARDSKLSWNADTDDAWQNPSLFGTAILQGLLPCTTPAAPTVTAAISYCQNSTATALTATGTSLLWYASSTSTTGSATATVPSTTTAGTVNYYVTQNVGGCESSKAQIAVTVNAAPNAPTVTTPVTYCQNAAATQLTATGTALKWYANNTTTTALTAAPTPLTATAGITSYFVSQTTNGCESARAQITVTINALPAATITTTTPTTFCAGGSVTLTSNTGSSYIWKNETGQVGTGSTYTATTAGSYTVDVFNANNCKATSAATIVTVNAAPSAPAVTTPAVYCHNATAVALTATGIGLKWYANNTTATALASAPVPSTTAIGTTNYYVSQTTNGCESPRAQVAVIVNALPTAMIATTTSTTLCTGGSVILTASTGSSYIWRNGGTQVGTGVTYTATAAGSYTVEVFGANNCKATSAATTVTVNVAPSAPTVITPVNYCKNAEAVALTASGTGLKWYADNTTTTALASTPVPSTTVTGTTNYYVSQTTNGCESTRTLVDVTINALPTAVITPAGSTTIVQGGSVVLNANSGSGLSYIWFKGTEQVATGISYTATAAGAYVVEVTNGSGCKATSLATDINSASNQPSIITITSPTANTTVNGSITITASISDADGSITKVEYMDENGVIGTSTSTPYSFDWTNPSEGNHTITIRVTDSNGGITTSAPVTVTVVSTTTGTRGAMNNTYANIYPIPARDEIIIETGIDLMNAVFNVTNVLGEEVTLSISVEGTDARMHVSELPEGAYLLFIRQGSNIITRKIIVAN